MSFPVMKNRSVLAPMSGVTDIAFRALCRHYGAGMTYTEFVSSAALVRGSDRTFKMLETDPSENPVGVQLFGGDVEEVVEAGKLLEKRFDVIDVNCGCPAFKVIKTGAGSEMLKDSDRIASFVSRLSESLSKPVTVKVRTGIDQSNINVLEVARKVEAAGASAITVHGRTQVQGYSGKADWDIIKKVKKSVSIPVIGNGDVFTPEDFTSKLESSGVNYVMVGRAAMVNPYIFRQIEELSEEGSYTQKSGKEVFFEYLRLAERYRVPFIQVKNHAVSFTKGLVGGADVRRALVSCTDIDSLAEIMEKI